MNMRSIILATALGLGAFLAQAEVITITQGSTSGFTMTDGNTYVIQDPVCFSNSVAGGNGMTVADGATVVIYIPTNVTLTAIGANSDGQIGGGAGILVPETSTLVVTGEGNLNARGGNAGNGGNGEEGKNGNGEKSGNADYVTQGTGGSGGFGGGGAGSAIGGKGGAGGAGGSGIKNRYQESSGDINGGSSGVAGKNGTGGYSSGVIYLIGRLKVNAKSGTAAKGGNAGGYQEGICWSGNSSHIISGGGGGGGGGAGSCPEFSIGSGGRGGGGGGSGGNGASMVRRTSLSCRYGYGGGGIGGKSAQENGRKGNNAGTIMEAVNSSGVWHSYPDGTGGTGGNGGDAGPVGDDGTLFISQLVNISISRDSIVTNSHKSIQYAITFDPNGGVLSSNVVIATLGVEQPQPVPNPVRDVGYTFAGWTTEPKGGALIYSADGVAQLSSYTNTTPITLFAQWGGELGGQNYDLEFASTEYKWNCAYEEGGSGDIVIHSAAIPDGTNSLMKTVVTGPGKLSFDWKVSCENRYAYLQVLIDGVQQKRITGAKDWASLLYEIGAGEHEIVWNYVKDGAAAVGDDAGFVRDISWRPYLAFSSVSAHGTALPADNDALLYGDTVEASVDASVTDGDVRYDCVGWRGTGSAPAEGVSNTCAFVLREDSSLTWLWRTNYWTALSVEGPATADVSEAWLEAGSVRTVAVAPSVPYYAITLSGDTAGVTLDGTNVVIVADGPRELTVSVRELTLAGALGTTDLAWRTGGDSVWFPEASVSADGLDAAQSGALDAKGTGWIETTVIGPGTLSFKWRFAPGSANSGIDLLVDGDYEDGLTDATDGWEDCSVEIGAGRHVVRWEFYGSNGENGIVWLDHVSWDGDYPTATSTTPDPVPYVWLDANAKPFVTRFYGDYEAAAYATAANTLNSVYECYVAGISPTNATDVFRAVISMNGETPVIGWEPDLNEGGTKHERVYAVEGCESLTDGDWGAPNAASRFFRVKVSLP